MPELSPQERLQPALLDRLTDDDPGSVTEPREKRVIGRQRLREAVLRDLSWLFNATALAPVEDEDGDFAGLPYAAHSAVNYGIPALSGETASTLDVVKLEGIIRQAIVDFEPRIAPASLRVEAILSDTQLEQHNVVSVQIQGDLWAQPVPLEVLLRTDVDLETGAVEIRDLGAAAGARR